MRKTFLLSTGLSVCLLSVPFVYLSVVFPGWPEMVPVQYDVQGDPNRWGRKTELPIVLAFLSLLILSIGTGMAYFRRNAANARVFRVLQAGMSALLGAMVLHTFYRTGEPQSAQHLSRLVNCAILLFLTFSGHFMYSLTHNQYSGMPAQLALSAEDSQMRDIKLSARIWCYVGLFLSALALVIPYRYQMAYLIAALVLLILFSLLYYRHLKKAQPHT